MLWEKASELVFGGFKLLFILETAREERKAYFPRHGLNGLLWKTELGSKSNWIALDDTLNT